MEKLEELGSFPVGERTATFGMYACDSCQKPIKVRNSHIKSHNGNCLSCSAMFRNTTHGKTNSVLFNRWQGMKDRCYNKNRKSYDCYGAIGVTVCDEWLHDFEAFEKWSLENGFSIELELDKDELSLGVGFYSPNTCQWITKERNLKIQNETQDRRKDGRFKRKR